MCSGCGGAARLRTPGATPRAPIIFGEADGQAAQPVTFRKEHAHAKPGQYLYVSGDGVAAAVDDGIIEPGYRPGQSTKAPARAKAKASSSAPEWYVATGRNKWVGFSSKAAAERYAKSVGSPVVTRDEVLEKGGKS